MTIIIPRPGAVRCPAAPTEIVPAPAESSFTRQFGAQLPPAAFLTTGHGRVAYYSIPPGSAPPAVTQRVLLVHGVQTPALGMLPLVRALQSARPHSHCALFDLWGHGLSDTPVAPHVPELFTSLIDGVLDELGWADAHLVGFSFGGSTVAGYVARSSGRVRSMALVAPAGLLRVADFTAEQRSILAGSDEAAARDVVFEFLEGGALVVPPDWEQRVAEGEIVAESIRQWELDAHEGYAASVVAIFRDGGVLDRHAIFAQAARTAVPNIAILGARDDVCTLSDLEDVGFTNVVVVPEAGHGVVRENAAEVAASVVHFWATLEH